MKSWRNIILLLMLLLGAATASAADDYPARCRVTTDLNARSCASKGCQKIGLLHKNEFVTVEYLTRTDSDPWGAVNYGSRRGYISMHHVNYVNCIGNPQPRHETKPPDRRSLADS